MNEMKGLSIYYNSQHVINTHMFIINIITLATLPNKYYLSTSLLSSPQTTHALRPEILFYSLLHPQLLLQSLVFNKYLMS